MTTQTKCGDERSSEVTASSHAQLLKKKEQTQPQGGGRASSFQPDADDKRSGTSNFPRAETALVAMQLRGDGQSRDEGLHGRTQLWASATRQLMSQEDAHVNRCVSGGHVIPTTLDSNANRESSEAKQDRWVHNDSARGSLRSRQVR